MKKKRNDGQDRGIAKLKAIRIALICIGVVIALSLAAIHIWYSPSLFAIFAHKEAPDPEQTTVPTETVQETTLPTETTQETTAPAETTQETTAPTEATQETTAPTEATQETTAPTETTPETSVPESLETPGEEAPKEELPKEPDNKKPEGSNEELDPAADGGLLVSHSLDSVEQGQKTEAPAQTAPMETEISQPEKTEPVKSGISIETTVLILYILLGMDLAAIAVVSVMISARKKKLARKQRRVYAREGNMPMYAPERRQDGAYGGIQVAGLHNIGARPYQEDSLGVSVLGDGVLAVVADGMGGLSNGDRVSQKIVHTMLGYGKTLRPGQMDGILEAMVNGVSQEVNQMLGPDGLYKSGSTLLSVLVRGERFHWATVGDSRIYYYHNRKLTQLNQEHNVGQGMLLKATCGEISFEEAKSTPKKGRVTSFIGMGDLKYMEKSCRAIPLEKGDRILLMTDGVFNALPDQTILAVLNNIPDIQAAAAEMEALVVRAGNPKQDNFTAIILGL